MLDDKRALTAQNKCFLKTVISFSLGKAIIYIDMLSTMKFNERQISLRIGMNDLITLREDIKGKL